MRTVLAMNASNLVFVEPTGNVFWIVANGPASLRVAMNRSLMLADQRSATQGDAIKRVDLIILIVAEVIFLLVIACIIIPAVFRVAASRQAVFEVFIKVPLPIVRALRSSVQKRIEALQRAETEADVGVDVACVGEMGEEDEATEEADEEREKLADLAEEQHGSPAPVEMDDEDLSDEAMEKIESKAEKPKSKRKNKKA
jgi:signal transduction histidine kinase